MRCEGERPENNKDTRGRRHMQPKGGREEAVWLQFNNALVCHTWIEFVGHISMGGGVEMCMPHRWTSQASVCMRMK